MGKRFFDFVRHVNALFLFAVAVVAFGAVLVTAFGLGRSVVRDSGEAEEVVFDADGEPVRQFRLGDFDELTGTPYVRAELYAPEGGDGKHYFSSGSSSRYDIFNFLFYDTSTREARWLLDHNDYLLVQTNAVRRESADGNEKRVLGLLFLVATEDTDGDGELTSKDRAQLAVARPSGAGFTVLIDKATRFLGWHERDERTEVVLYTVDDEIIAADVDIIKGAIVSTTTLGPVPRDGAAAS